MKRILTLVVGTLVAVVLLVVVAGYLLLSNPETFQQPLLEVVESESGYRVSIGEPLAWQLIPFGLRLRQVEVAAAGNAFMAVDEATLGVHLLPLLSGTPRLDVAGIEVSGVRMDLRVDGGGASNWVPEASGDSAETDGDVAVGGGPAAGEGSGPAIALNVSRMSLRDVALSYHDRAAPLEMNVVLEEVTLENVSTAGSFPMAFRLRLEQAAPALVAAVAGDLEVALNTDLDTLSVSSLAIDVDAEMAGLAPIAARLSNEGTLVLSARSMTVPALKIDAAPLSITVGVDGENLDGEYALNGRVAAAPFDVLAATEMLQLGLARADLFGVETATLESPFELTPERVVLNGLQATLGESTLTGNVVVALREIPAIDLRLHLDEFDLTPAAAADSAGGEEPPAADAPDVLPEDVVLIPADDLRQLHLTGLVTADKVIFPPYEITGLDLDLAADGRKLGVTAKGRIDGGPFDGRLSLDLVGDVGGNTEFKLADLEMQRLAQTGLITGHLEADAKADFKGAKLSEILASLNAGATFEVRDGTLDITALKSTVEMIDQLRGKESSSAEWPDKFPFNQLNGRLDVVDGIEQDQKLDVRIENLHVQGAGGYHYFEDAVDYEVTATLREGGENGLPINPELTDIDWPIHCAGKVAALSAGACAPNSEQVQTLVAQLARKAVTEKAKEKLREKLGEKVPEELKDKAKGLLRNLFNR